MYDVNVISNLSEELIEDVDLMAGLCILYREGQYIGETFFGQKVKKMTIVDAINSGLPLLINKEYLQNKCDITTELNIESVRIKETQIPCLCHETIYKDDVCIEENKAVINSRGTCGVKGLLTRIFWEKQKIRVAFIVQMLEVWDKQAPVFEAMDNNPSIDVSIIVVPSIDTTTWELNSYAGELEFMSHRYPKAKVIQAVDDEGTVIKLNASQYDYIFYPRPYDIYLPVELRSLSVTYDTKVCYIPYGYPGANAFTELHTNEDFFRNVYISFLDSEAMKDVLEKKFEENVANEEQKFLYLGYPVFDTYLRMRNKNWDENQSILWTPRWAFNSEQGGSHFVQYKDSFVELRNKYPQNRITIRPHPLMWENVVKEGFMSQADVNDYKSLLQSCSIKIDTNKMIEDTIRETKVLITDFSSIIITYFMTGRPIIYCPLDTHLNDMYQKLLPGLYIANSWDEVEKYLEMIENGNDILLKKRQEIIEKELSSLGGGTKRIVKAIIDDFKKG